MESASASNNVLDGIGSVHKEELESLPMELLTEILMKLEWSDVLRVRATSRRLYDASKALDLWLYLFLQYTSTSLISPCLEAPFDTYIQEDLEDWLLRRIGADIGWKQDAKQPTLHRIINDNESENLHLIEGGRWLIGVSRRGPVMCHDLDAPGGIKSEVLIRLEQIVTVPSLACWVSSSIDMLPESPTLSFNLAVIHLRVACTDRRGLVTTSIFNVGLVGSGPSAYFKARCLLSHFCDNPILEPEVIDLCGTHLAIFSHTTDNFRSYLDILDWTKMQGTDYPRRTTPTPRNARIRLLPDGQVVCFFGLVATIDRLDARQIVTSAGDESPWSPMWKLDMGLAGHFVHISERVFDPNSGSYSFIFSTQTHIHCLLIPSSRTVSPYLSPVMPYLNRHFDYNFLALGKHRGFNFPHRSPFHLLTYGSNLPTNYPSDGTGNAHRWYVTHVGYAGSRNGDYHKYPSFDEATGRVVIRNEHPLRMLEGVSSLKFVHDISIFDFGVYPPRC